MPIDYDRPGRSAGDPSPATPRTPAATAMRLVISRAQRDLKGMLGGHEGVEFTLNYRLELGQDELDLVRRYHLKDACDEIPVLLRVCRSFGGQEVVHSPR